MITMTDGIVNPINLNEEVGELRQQIIELQSRLDAIEKALKLKTYQQSEVEQNMAIAELQHFQKTFEPLVKSLVEGMNDAMGKKKR